MSLIIAGTFDRLGIDQIIRQMVVDFGVGQVPTVFTGVMSCQGGRRQAGFRVDRLERRQGLERSAFLQ